MYQPAAFQVDEIDLARALTRDYPLATLITLEGQSLEANHIPMHWREDSAGLGSLVAHVARPNLAWRASGEVLVVFQGPTAYISPNWYASKQEHHRVVPTYNYAVVHIRGSITVHDDPEWIRAQLTELTDRMEMLQQEPTPWRVSDAPREFVAGQINGIVGIEIAVTSWEGKWKVSQNRTFQDRSGVADALGSENPAMARLVEPDRAQN